jgi:hypothetical protein
MGRMGPRRMVTAPATTKPEWTKAVRTGEVCAEVEAEGTSEWSVELWRTGDKTKAAAGRVEVYVNRQDCLFR